MVNRDLRSSYEKICDWEAPGDIRMKRTLIVAMVAPMVMPMASLFAASHASAADLPVPGPAPAY